MATRLIDELSSDAKLMTVLGLGAALLLPPIGIALFWFTGLFLVLRVAIVLLSVAAALASLVWAAKSARDILNPLNSTLLAPLDAHGPRKEVFRRVQTELSTDTKTIGKHRLTQNWVLFAGTPLRISHAKDVMWAYEQVTRTVNENEIHQPESRRLHLWLRSGQTYEYPFHERETPALLAALVARNPDLYLGHNAAIAAGVKHNAVEQLHALPALARERRERHEKGDVVEPLYISADEAAHGAKKEVLSNGALFTLSVPPGVTSGVQMRLKGKGVPRPDGQGVGDLYVQVIVQA